MRISLLGTLANKHKTRIAPIYRRLRTEVKDRGRCQTALTVTRERGEGKKPLLAMFGDFVGMEERRDLERPPASDLRQRSQRDRPTPPRAEMRALWLRGRTFRGPPRPPSRRSGPAGAQRPTPLGQADGCTPPQDLGRMQPVPSGYPSGSLRMA